MKRIKFSFVLEIILLCAGLVLIASLSMRFFAYKTAKTTIEETMGQMALNITRSVKDSIDVTKFEQLQTPDDMQQEYYIQLREELNRIKEINGLKYLYTMRAGEDGSYYYVVDGAPKDSEDVSLLGDVEEDISDTMLTSLAGTEAYEFYDSEEWGALISGYVPIKNDAGATVGMLGADFDAEYMLDKLSKANQDMYFITGIIILISVIIAISFAYLIVNSLKQLQEKMHQVQQGDLTIKVINNRSDEVGSLSRTFQGMLDNMALMINSIREHSNRVLEDIKGLNTSIEVSNNSTEEITKIVSEIAVGASDQLDNAEAAAKSMERVFTEIEAITEHINLTNQASDLVMKDMQEASDKLIGSVKQINLVNTTVETTAVMMKQLEEKFKEVLSFSSSVESIASRTNLLALNASIEAASAGEHGKGFAVVAGEIKNLAKQSAEASKRINELIFAVQEEINNSGEAIENGVVQAKEGVEAMTQVEEYLTKLSDSNQKIDSRIKDIAKAIVNIEVDSKNVLDKTTILAEISKQLCVGTQQTAAETEEQYAIAVGIKNDLTTVKDRMEQLEGTVYRFKV